MKSQTFEEIMHDQRVFEATQEPMEVIRARADLTIEYYRKLKTENAGLRAEVKRLKAELKKRR